MSQSSTASKMVSRPRPTWPMLLGLSAVVALLLAAPALAVAGIRVAPRTLSTAEGGSAQTFTVRLGFQPTADVEIAIRSNDLTEGTVSPTVLWFGPTARTVVVGRTPRNIYRWDDARTVTVRPQDDTIADLAQEYTITLDARSVDDSGVVQDAYYNDDARVPNQTVRVTNADNDHGLVPSKTALATAEDGSADSFTVRLSTRPSAPVAVAIALDGTEGAAAPAALTFDGSTWNTARTVTVTGLDDTLDDGNVRYTLTLTPSSTDTDYDGSAKAVTLTVDNNDDDLVAALRLTPATIAESGTGNVTTVTATLNRTRSVPTTVTVSVPADAGATLSANTALTIAAGATTSTGAVTVTAVDDGTDAPDKTVRVSGTSSAGVGHPRSVTLTITDDDAAPSLSISSPFVSEGDSGQRTVPLTVTLSAASGWEVTVGYGLDGTDGGTATAGTDYTAIVPGTLTFPAGTTSRSISVLVTGDTIDEPDETIRVTLRRPTNATGTPTGTGTIGDDDPTPQATLALTPASIAEDGGAATVTATLDRASGAATTLTVAAAPVSPAVDADFRLSANRRLEIAAGSTASTGMVTFTAVNNAAYAGNKTVTVSATAQNAHAITAPTSVALTIADDEMGPPGKPGSVTVTAGVGSLALSWPQATDADGYKVQWKSGQQAYDAARQHVLTTSSATNTYTIGGLTAGTEYTVQVIATRARAADGPASDAATGTPKAAPPGQPASVTVTPGIGSLAVSWGAAANATGYKVQWKSGQQNYNTGDRQATPTGTSHTITSLTAGTAYTVRVIATRTHAADGPALAATPAEPRAAAPGQPTGVTVTAGVGSLSVSWTAADDADGYKVQWKSGSQAFDAARQVTASGTSRTLTGLPSGTTYTVRVIATRAHAADGTPSATVTGTPMPAPPGQVPSVTVTRGVGQLSVSWTAAANATGYKVQWKSGQQAYDASRQATASGTSHTITGLTGGTAYTVRVIATRTDAADGPPSAEASGVAKKARPAAPAGLDVKGNTAGGVSAEWGVVEGADGYKVQWKTISQAWNTTRQAVVPPTTEKDAIKESYTITGLTPGAEYTVRVFATLAHADDSLPSSTASDRAGSGGITVSSLTITPGIGSLALSWPFAKVGLTDPTGYLVEWKLGTAGSYGGTNTHVLTTASSTNTYTITGLTGGTEYDVRVTPRIGSANQSGDASEGSATTRNAAPGQPAVTVTPGVRSLALSWAEPTGADGYKVQWKTGSQAWDATRQHVLTTSSATNTYTITGLTPGTEYTVRVIATRAHAADGTPSATVARGARAVPPGQVETVTVTPGTGSLALSWSAAANATGYKVQWKSGTQNYNTGDRQATPTGTSHTITSLTAGTAYTVRVIATRTNAADGPASVDVRGTPLAASPGQPSNVQAAARVGALEVSWGTVTTATGYKVQWKTGSEAWSTSRQRAASASPATITGLTAGTAYTVRVIATLASAADGPASATVTGTPRYPAPPVPDSVTVTAGIERLTVNWSAAAGAGGYEVQWKSGQQSYNTSDRRAVVTGGTSHTVTGLTGGTRYTVRVIATRTGAPDSGPSAETLGTPGAAAPGRPTGVSATAAVEGLDVTWTGDATATGYKVQWKSGQQDWDAVARQVTASGTSRKLTGLVAGTAYTVRVIATRTHAADGPPSATATGTPKATSAAQPMNVRVVAGIRRLTVTWDSAADATGYTVQWKSGQQNYAAERSHTPAGVNVRTYVIQPLTPGTAYTVVVSATRTNADPVVSADRTGTPKASPPGRPTNVAVTPGALQLAVTWTSAADATGYKVQWRTGGQSWDATREDSVTSVTGTGQSHTVTGLRPGTEYTVRVIATRTHADDGPASASVTVRTMPPGLVVSPTALSLREEPGHADRTKPYTVRLNAPPSGAVTVRVTNSATDAVDAAPTALTFTATTWNTAQTVTAAARNDADTESETVTLAHRVSGTGDTAAYPTTLAAVDVTVQVTDDDGGLDLGTASGNTTEAGGTATFTVALLSTPSAAVTVSATSPAVGGRTEGTPAPTSLTFAAAAWNTAQTVTVTGQDDEVDDGDVAYTVRLTPASTDSTYHGAAAAGSVSLTNEDDDDAGLTVSAVTGDATEATGDTATVAVFDVQLDTEPTAGVTITVASKDTGEGTAAPGNLTFTASSWNTAQTVTVTGANDDLDDGDQTYDVELDTPADDTGAAEYEALDAVTVSVKTIDDDTGGVTFDPTSLTLTEGDTTGKTFTFRLTAEPPEQVSVGIHPDSGLSANGRVHPSQWSRVIRPQFWKTAVTTVTVKALEDDDTQDETLTVKYSLYWGAGSPLNETTGTQTAVTVTVTDDDHPALTVSPTALSVDENATATYTVALATLPSAPVTVTVVDGAATDDVTRAPGVLTFTGTTWDTAQTVTVSAGEDDDGRDDTASLTHTVTSDADSGYHGLHTAQPARVPAVAVTVDDDDDVGVTVDTDLTLGGAQTTALSVAEDGGVAKYTVVLKTEPSGAVTVTPADPADVDVAPAALTFATGTWNTAQTVTVTGEPDDDVDDEAVSVTHALTTAAGGDYAGATVSAVAVTVTDGDSAGLAVSAAGTGLTVPEGTSGTYTLALTSRPGGPVTVRVTSSDAAAEVDTDTTRQTRTLTFAAGAWNTAQTVTVRAPADADGRDETATLRHTAASSDADYVIATAQSADDVAVTVTDANPPGLVVDTDADTGGAQTTLTLYEESAHTHHARPYTVRLNAQPGGPVTVRVTSGDAAVEVDTDATPQQRDLTFTGTTWNTAQTVTATAADDADTESETVTLSHAVHGSGDATSYPTSLAAVTVTVTVRDDDGGFDLGMASGNTTEGGGTATFTVALQSAPSVAVPVTVASQDGSEGTAAPGSLTFTGTTWNTARTVTVTGQDDDIDDGNVAYTVRLTPAGTDPVYGSVAAQDVSLTNEDDDTAALTVSAVTGAATEMTGDGATVALFDVQLATEPTAVVTVSVASQDTGEGTAAPASLTFGTGSWNTAQTVTVTGVDDDLDDGDQTYAIHLDPDGVTGDAYTGLATHTGTRVTTRDDDTAGVTVNPTSVSVTEQDATGATFTVVLATQPGGTVTVSVDNANDASAVTANGVAGNATLSLTFTTAAWNTAQTVTVLAGNDANVANETETLTLGVSNYTGVSTVDDVTVTVTDNDGGLDVGAVSGNTTEAGDAATFTVALLSAPSVAVTVSVASQDTGEGTAAPASLTFGTGSWNTAQTVTVTGVDDDIDDGNVTYTVRLTPASTDAVYGSVAAQDVSLTNEDDTATNTDTAALTVSGVTGAATEATGDGATVALFDVQLATEPTAAVTVSVTSQDTGEGTAAPASLTFGTGSWNTAQTVTVTGVDDDLDDGDQTYAVHLDPDGVAGDAYTGLATHTSTQVTTRDDDTAGLVVDTDAGTDGAQTTLALEEEHATNGAKSYTVRLGAEPGGPVTVRVASGDAAVEVDTDATRRQRDLTFTAATWDTAQTVTATAAADDDATGATVTVAHTVHGSGDATAYPTTLAAVNVTVTVTDDDTVGVTVDTDPSTPATADSTGLTVSDDGTTTTDTYTVVLDTEPSGAVTITPDVPATPDVVAVAPGGLTFDATTWNTARTVTVSGKTDADAADTAVSLAHTLATDSGGDYHGTSVAAVSVTVTDADTVGVTVDTDLTTNDAQTTALAVTEGATGVYTLVLDTQPSAPVTIALAATPQKVSLAPAALTFARTAWATAQTVTVTGTHDADTDDVSVTLAHTLTTAAGGDYAAVSVADVTVNVTDDEVVVGFESQTQSAAENAGTASVCVAVTNPSNSEALPRTFSLRLRTADGTATDGTAAAAGTDYTALDRDVGPFAAATRRTCVALSLLDNAVDAADKTLTLGLDYRLDTSTPDPNDEEDTADYVILSPGTLTFTITDDDAKGVTVDTDLTMSGTQATTLSVSEDGTTTTAAYAVVLTSQPSGNVTIAAADAPDRVDLAPTGPLVFTPASWATAQTVTVAGKPDDLDATTETVTLTHTLTTGATGDYAAETVAAVTVTVTDDDTPGLLVTPTALALAEEGAAKTYTLRLNTRPGGPVTVGVDNADDGSAVTANGTAANATLSLTFAAAAWNTAQTVTVAAGHDDDGDDDTVTLTHTTASGDGDFAYAAPRAGESVTVTVTDDDTAGVTVAPTSVSVTEEDTTGATFTVVLATQPGGTVTVGVDNANDASAVTANGTAGNMTLSLTFATTAWNTAQTVTVLAEHDNDTQNETETLELSVANYSGVTEVDDVTVTVTDDDSPNLSVSAAGLTGDGLGEQTAETYTVALTTQPSGGTVTVGVRSDNGDVTVATGTQAAAESVRLRFDASSWNTAQAVTVAAGHDEDGDDDAVTLTHTPGGADYAGLAAVSLSFTVVDNDARGVTLDADPATPLMADAGPLAVYEDAAHADHAAPYTVRLATQPVGGNVTVTLTNSHADAVTVAPARLVFTASSWNTARTVTATARDDTNGTGERATLTHTAVGGDYPATPPVSAALTVDVTDDDSAGLRVSTAALTVAEPAGGSTPTARYTVRLNTRPGGLVTVGVAEPTPNPDVGVSPTALTFDANSWNTAQTVTVTPAADADAADDETTLRHTVTGSGATDYPTTLSAVDVRVTVEDAQTAGVTVSATGLELREEGTPASLPYTVVLDAAPTGLVTVGITSSDADAVSRTPAALTFTAATWATAQAVTAAAQADFDGADERVTLTHGLTTGAAEYADVRVAAVTVTVTDDDERGLVPGPTSLGMNEEDTATYALALNTQPTGDVAVRIDSDHAALALQGAGQGTAVETLWLSFTPNGWNTAQTVTVHAAPDADTLDEAATLTHTATGADYGGVTRALAVDVLDTTPLANPAPGPDVTPTFAAATLPAQEYKARQRVRVQLPAATDGNPPLTYTLAPALPAGLTYDGPTRRIVGAATAAMAAAVYTHTATDADGDTAEQTVSVTVVANAAPTFAAPAPRYEPGTPYRLSAPSGGDGRLAFALTPALPEGLVYTPPVPSGMPGAVTYADGGTIGGTPTGALPTHEYTLTVTDADGDMTTLRFRLAQPVATPPAPTDGRPTFGNAAVEPQQYRQGDAIVALQLPAATGGDAPLRYALTPALPAGLSFDAARREIAGTPTELQAETTYTLTATDADGDAASLTFTLTVEADLTPSFGDATVAAQRYTAGVAIAALALPAATGGNAPLRYALTPALPAGLTYAAPGDPAAAGGTLGGTPTEVRAETTYTLTATDADGDAATLTFTLTVTETRRLVPREGTTTYTVNGQPVTVTMQPGTRAGVELVLPATLDRAVTVTLGPPAADVPLTRGRFGFGTDAAARSVVDVTVAPVPAGGIELCLPIPAALRTAAAGRRLLLLHYAGGRWEQVPDLTETAGQVCATGVTAFSPFAAGYANARPTFRGAAVQPQEYDLDVPIPPLGLPPAEGGDGPLRYTPPTPELPAGLTYTAPADPTVSGGTIAGTPTVEQAATTYTLTATDVDGDVATLEFSLAVVQRPARVTIADATGQEGAAVEFTVTLSRPMPADVPLTWTAGTPGSATPGADYVAESVRTLTLPAGTTAGTLRVRTLDDPRVEPAETFTVTATLPGDVFAELATPAATGTIEDDDAPRARKRGLGMALAGVGRTLATDAVDVIGDRFQRQPGATQAMLGGQALTVQRDAQTGRWRHASRVAYGVARALGVEVGSPLEGGDDRFGHVRGAAWSALTRHLRDPHTPTAPLSAWDAPGAFAVPAGPGLEGPAATGWGSPGLAGGIPSISPPFPSTGSGTGEGLEAGAAWGGSVPPPSGRGLGGGRPSAWENPAGDTYFDSGPLPGLAGYGEGLAQRGFDRAHAATPEAFAAGTWRMPVQFRRVSGAELMSQSEFEIPLSREPLPDAPSEPAGVSEESDAAVDTAARAEAAAWTLWGRGTASGFNGRPKDDFSMAGDVFTGYLGLDYRLQPNVLLGLAVAHSRGDVDYETTDVTKGDVDVTLTSVLPYAHWTPRPGLGVWGLLGAGWGDLDLTDEAGEVKTDLEMLMAAVGARQELLTWRRIELALKADAFLTELEAGSEDGLPTTAGDAQRVRLMLEGRTAWALSEESHLTPIFEIGGRWDGGKAETGVGAELGGGFEYAHTKLGLGIAARGRYLLAHQKSAFDEWGASLTLKLDPGAEQRGLWLSLAPIWGAEASQVEQMWGSAEALRTGEETDPETAPGLAPASVELDVGYGLVTHEGVGLLTTYGGVSLAGPGSRGVRLGGSLAVGEWIDLSVEGERTTHGGSAEHQVALYGHLCW